MTTIIQAAQNPVAYTVNSLGYSFGDMTTSQIATITRMIGLFDDAGIRDMLDGFGLKANSGPRVNVHILDPQAGLGESPYQTILDSLPMTAAQKAAAVAGINAEASDIGRYKVLKAHLDANWHNWETSFTSPDNCIAVAQQRHLAAVQAKGLREGLIEGADGRLMNTLRQAMIVNAEYQAALEALANERKAKLAPLVGVVKEHYPTVLIKSGKEAHELIDSAIVTETDQIDIAAMVTPNTEYLYASELFAVKVGRVWCYGRTLTELLNVVANEAGLVLIDGTYKWNVGPVSTPIHGLIRVQGGRVLNASNNFWTAIAEGQIENNAPVKPRYSRRADLEGARIKTTIALYSELVNTCPALQNLFDVLQGAEVGYFFQGSGSKEGGKNVNRRFYAGSVETRQTIAGLVGVAL